MCGGKCWFFEYKITGLLKSPGISFFGLSLRECRCRQYIICANEEQSDGPSPQRTRQHPAHMFMVNDRASRLQRNRVTKGTGGGSTASGATATAKPPGAREGASTPKLTPWQQKRKILCRSPPNQYAAARRTNRRTGRRFPWSGS